jgi:hypothetical protein
MRKLRYTALALSVCFGILILAVPAGAAPKNGLPAASLLIELSDNSPTLRIVAAASGLHPISKPPGRAATPDWTANWQSGEDQYNHH